MDLNRQKSQGRALLCSASSCRYDPYQDRWGPVPKLNTPRFALAAAATHGALYAVGGFNGDQYMSTVEMLDPRVGRYYCTAFCYRRCLHNCCRSNRIPHCFLAMREAGWTYQTHILSIGTDQVDCLALHDVHSTLCI